MADQTGAAKLSIGWWVDTGPDSCESCWRTYYAEVGHYCSHCDRAICPGCILTFEQQWVLCPDCFEERGDFKEQGEK